MNFSGSPATSRLMASNAKRGSLPQGVMSPNAVGSSSGAVRRRILLLSPFAPRLDASMGGPVVIAQLIMALSQREHLALLYLRGADEPPLDDRVKAACEVTIETRRPDFHADAASGRRGMRPAACAVRGIPSWVADWWVPAVRHNPNRLCCGVAARCRTGRVSPHGTVPALARPARPPTVLNQHEPGAAAAADRRCSGLMPGYILPRLDVHAWRHYERRLAQEVDAIVTFTERDRKAMQDLAPRRGSRSSRRGHIYPKQRTTRAELSRLLCFSSATICMPRTWTPRCGSHGTSIRGLRAEMPDLRLWLPGDRAPAGLTALADEQFLVPGRVPDLKPYLDQAAVVVAPLRIGGGMRVKVLEALAAGKAVVASRLAAEGLQPGRWRAGAVCGER